MNGKQRLFSFLMLFAVSITIVAVVFLMFSLNMLSSPTAYNGLSIGGIEISSLTYDEAALKLDRQFSQKVSQKQVVINFNGNKEVVDYTKLGVRFSFEKSLNELFKEGKHGGFFERLDAIRFIETEGKNFPFEVVVDDVKISDTVKALSGKYYKAPVEASLHFDPKEVNLFRIEDAVNGSAVNIPNLVQDLKVSLLKGHDQVVEAKFVDIAATRTPNDLMANTKLIGRYQTELNNNSNRTANIKLFCSAINGAVIQPGEVYSLNGITGERTVAKGYFMAPTIVNGTTIVDDYGGGICQVSGTLYNALLLTDLTIVERSAHSWPSDYAPLGQDATITWPNRDFKFSNNHDGPVFLRAFTEGNQLIVEIYGKPLADNVKIEVLTEIVKIENPPSPVYIADSTLKSGRIVTAVTSRKGYTTKTYRVYVQNGQVIKKELIANSRYKAMRGEFRIGIFEEDAKDQDETEPIVPIEAAAAEGYKYLLH